jgi:hypothetical protein
MRISRDSPPELALEFPGPYESSSATRFPARRKHIAVHAPKTPAPITTASYEFVFMKFVKQSKSA